MKEKKEKIVLIVIALFAVGIFMRPLLKPLFKSKQEEVVPKKKKVHYPDNIEDYKYYAIQYEKDAADMVFDSMKNCRLSVGTMRTAIALLQKSVSIDNKYLLGYSMLIQYQSQIKDFDGAFKTLHEAEKWLPKDPQIAQLGGLLYDVTGKKQMADNEYQRSICCLDKRLNTKYDVGDAISKSIMISFLKDTKDALAFIKKESTRRHYDAKDSASLKMIINALETNSIRRDDIVNHEMTNSLINFNL